MTEDERRLGWVGTTTELKLFDRFLFYFCEFFFGLSLSLFSNAAPISTYCD